MTRPWVWMGSWWVIGDGGLSSEMDAFVAELVIDDGV